MSMALIQANYPALSIQDIDRLLSWKWRYALESRGFSSQEALRLLFARYLVGTGRLTEGRP